ncbi:hypothetical protein [Rossellomorea vietnamensis]|uniref:hypothetical protein n=1 Tax=Rossellomorea vietnamensis TaxID=218284 RepID=UPI001E48DABA|nr:hypothetical protein [Rossellomorea vietnamensis]MCC5801914.1 hypothetical protein [Rossellomorea vietnamensis]
MEFGEALFVPFMILLDYPGFADDLPRGFYPTEDVTEIQRYDRGIYPAETLIKIQEYKWE